MTANVSTMTLTDGRQVCLSYGVPVAAFIPFPSDVHSANYLTEPSLPYGYLKTDRHYSVTSTRHANQFCGGKDRATVVPHDVFTRLIAPVAAEE